MTRLYYREASACVIMFDVTNVSTFSNSQKWKQDLDSKLTLPDGSPVPCLLLANKVSSTEQALCMPTPPRLQRERRMQWDSFPVGCRTACGRPNFLNCWFVCL